MDVDMDMDEEGGGEREVLLEHVYSNMTPSLV
jgi:hypothetical protein